MATTDERKESPLRSLSSFKAEIPGGDGLVTTDSKDSSKTIHQYLDMVINGPIFLSFVVLLVLVLCVIVTVELLIEYDAVLPNTDEKEKGSILKSLSATSLAILAFFIFEAVGRIFSMGMFIKTQRMEIFDIIVIAVTFVTDLVFLASEIEESEPATRSVTFLISLRLWRIFGIYHNGVTKAREEGAAELHMEKYARNQAEVQADALQAQCDQQLKEIAHLRDYMRQCGIDPDSPNIRYPLEYRHGYGFSPDFDKADTVRVNDRVNSESSLASAIATFEATNEVERRGEVREGEGRRGQRQHLRASLPSSLPSSSSSSSNPVQLSTAAPISAHIATAGHSNAAFEVEVGEEAKEQRGARKNQEDMPEGVSQPPPPPPGAAASEDEMRQLEGITNPAFEDDHHGNEETGEISTGHSSPSSNNNADCDEMELRYELDEINTLTDAAIMEELAGATSITQDINGVPTTSL